MSSLFAEETRQEESVVRRDGNCLPPDTPFLFGGPGAESAAAAFAARAKTVAARWWRVTPTAQPSWPQ